MDRRRGLAALGGSILLAGVRPLAAQPAAGRIVVGFAPGGSVDSLARIAAEAIQRATGRPTVVENRTGAAGRVAIEHVKAAAPDGATLVVVPQGPMTLFTHVFKGLRFDPVKDFVPVTGLASGDFALTTGPMTQARDLAGFRDWLTAAGDKATYGSPGAGTLPHFVGVSIARAIGTPMTHVPYRGSTLAMTDLAGGTIAAAVSPVTEALELHKSGRVRIIATTGPRRSPFVPEVPTLREAGIAVEVPLWFAMYAPAATPASTVGDLRAAVQAALAAPAAQERITQMGLVPFPAGADELNALQRSETAMWGPVVKASGFTPED